MAQGQPSVLVVDDEPEVLELFSDFLAEEFDVTVASSTEEALDALDASIDAVTLDLRMPGPSGDKVVEHIRETGLDCGVVIVSGVDRSADHPPCDLYLEKPVRRDELLDAVRQIITEK